MGLKILLVSCIFIEGNTSLLVMQALSNMGHNVVVWNCRIDKKPPIDDYDMAIIWTGRPLDRSVFGDKPVAYVYLDDPEYHADKNNDEKSNANTIEKCTAGYDKIFTNMNWEGMDEKKYTWLPMGCLYHVHGKVILSEYDKTVWGGDVVFIGTRRGKRTDFVNTVASRLDKKYKLRLWGNGWNGGGLFTHPVYFYDFAKVLSSSKIVITEHWKNAFSTNDCEKPACGGALTITDNALVKEEYGIIPYYRNIDELMDIIHYYLEHEAERVELAKQLQMIAYKKFSYENQLKKLISITLSK